MGAAKRAQKGTMTEDKKNTELDFLSKLANPVGRRSVLKWSGIAIGVLIAGCGGDGDDNNSSQEGAPLAPNELGAGDTGVLNYAYALEQLEAAFYQQVIASPYRGMSAAELQILTDIRDHEVIHRDFFKAALGENAIGDLEVTFLAVDFSSRQSVLTTARTFEDLGVSAYNGAARLIQDPENLRIAAKIVSVEARHAAVIRDLLSPRSAAFAGDDVVARDTGLDQQRAPSAVLALADPFIVTAVDAGRLPQN